MFHYLFNKSLSSVNRIRFLGYGLFSWRRTELFVVISVDFFPCKKPQEEICDEKNDSFKPDIAIIVN